MSHSTHVGFSEPRLHSACVVPRMSGWLPNIPCIFPAGVPAASSLAVGVGHIRTAPPSVVPRFVPIVFPTPLTCGLSCPVGVGHNPDAVASMRGADGASWNNKWDGAVPDAFQVRKAALEAQWLVNKASDIFANDPPTLYSFNNSQHFRPEISVIFCASLLPGNGEGLARETAADEVNSSKSICVDGSDVVVDRRVGPMLSQDGLAERLSLTECNCSKSSRCFESEAEPSDAAEEVEDGEVFF